jgi:hypothetical protein
MGDKPQINTQFLAGEVHALLTFAQVLAATHHDRVRLSARFQSAEQAGLARVEGLLADDSLVSGYQFVVGQIRKALELATEIRQSRD